MLKTSKVVTTAIETPIIQALIEDPGRTINFLLKQPGIVAICTSVVAFLLIRIWDLIRGHARESAKSTVLQLLHDHGIRQVSSQKAHEEKVMNMLLSNERTGQEQMIELVKITHALDKMDHRLSHYEKRIDKVEGAIHDLSR